MRRAPPRSTGSDTLVPNTPLFRSWPARRLGLADRGLLRQGMRADVVIFDLATIRDRATYEEPTAVPEGIGDVIVNGVVAVAGGPVTGSRSGNVLRHPCPTA